MRTLVPDVDGAEEMLLPVSSTKRMQSRRPQLLRFFTNKLVQPFEFEDCNGDNLICAECPVCLTVCDADGL